MNCGADLKNISQENLNNPSESTIEVKAEEIKQETNLFQFDEGYFDQ